MGSYGLPIKNQCWGLPYRPYVWLGDETEPVQISDPEYTGEGAAPLIDNPDAWCFVYGEKEWMSGVKYSMAFKQSKNYQLGINKPTDVDRRVSCH